MLGACDQEALPCCADCSSRQAVSLESQRYFHNVCRLSHGGILPSCAVALHSGGSARASRTSGLRCDNCHDSWSFECSTARPAVQIAMPHFIVQEPFTPPGEQDKRALLKQRAAARNRRLVGLKLLAAGGFRIMKNKKMC